ncbi:bifunctional RNase H/acid phosphatase [Streptomyces sp. ASQP_92]|uniref:bifunctional RNase H/acid phosphatase n=1 Tax=Streptomyces sp. ASQP_92 TaxID=2979116 RepID=UPI0021C0561B|nr:bifunctional RNase H/acid phosphatase [Streptomyces sp. ASQP_92]MCT9087936.1 bifunctional RNase H/acid phosphatase [Streptomyces sp. ASQP_92]
MPSSPVADRQFVVEADGGSRGNPGPAGYGAVVLDPATGETLAEAAEFIGVATNNVAEYKGLIAGLRAARALDPAARVRVRMDSKLVVEQMSGRWKIKHPDMKPLAAEAARVLPPSQVSYEWIPRERNKHADRLANEAMDAGRRGERWSPSRSTADLTSAAEASAADAGAARVVGDAAAGAARARAALAGAALAGAAPAGAAPAGAVHAAGSAHGAGSGGGAGSVAGGGLVGAGAGAGAHASAGVAAVEGATPVLDTAVEAAPSVGWGTSADLGAPATFVLLRHGETALTPFKRFSGSGGTDPELSAVGRDQAERVAAALAERGTVQAIVSSPLRRCRETAAAVAGRLGLDVHIEDGLRETDFGAWEGLTFGEVRERYPDDLDAWLGSAKAAPTGGGESFATVARRVSAARDRVIAAHPRRTVLVVTHVTPIKTLVRLALGAPPESLFRMELSAASISSVAYYGDGNASVRGLNDTGHLR